MLEGGGGVHVCAGQKVCEGGCVCERVYVKV